MNIAFLTFITSIVLSITSGICTVVGIGHIFTSAPLMTMAIASTIEVGRVVLVYVLHHFWKTMPWIKKIPGIIMLIIAMSLSALGVFGFFANAHSQKSQEIIPIELEISQLESEIPLVMTEIEFNNKHINDIQTTLSSDNMNKAIDKFLQRDYVSKALTIQKDMQKQITDKMEENKQLNNKIVNIKKKITELKIQAEEKSPSIAHLKYLAKLLNTTNDNAIIIFIVMIMLVFDTLAMYLMITSDWIKSKLNPITEIKSLPKATKKRVKKKVSEEPTIVKELVELVELPKKDEKIKNNIDLKVSKLVKLLLEDDSIISNPSFINSLSITPLIVQKLEEELGSESELMNKIKTKLKTKKVVK